MTREDTLKHLDYLRNIRTILVMKYFDSGLSEKEKLRKKDLEDKIDDIEFMLYELRGEYGING